MARQLPALVSGQRSLAQTGTAGSTVSRVLATVAPDVIRAAERLATQRLQARNQAKQVATMPEHTEAIHLSEVQIDVSVPFVRRITMRNMTAWQNGTTPPPVILEPEKPARTFKRKVGVIGATSLLAFGMGILARRMSPFGSSANTIIDVAGKPKP